MSRPKSAAYNHFIKENDNFLCTINIKDGENEKQCGTKFSGFSGNAKNKPSRCANLKRHLERSHPDEYSKVEAADKEKTQTKGKKPCPALQTLNAFMQPTTLSAKVTVTKEDFERGIIEMVVFNSVALQFFEKQGFQRINGPLAKSLGVRLVLVSLVYKLNCKIHF